MSNIKIKTNCMNKKCYVKRSIRDNEYNLANKIKRFHRNLIDWVLKIKSYAKR